MCAVLWNLGIRKVSLEAPAGVVNARIFISEELAIASH